ncbi:MAG TPA: hypothetical protein VN832_12360 [Stellaceae bacterium]|nr:hypothetical protein [Stellaceae bacterium]
MGKLVAIAVGVLVLIVIGGGAILMVWDVPAPTAHVERVIPDARFPR